VLRSIKYGVTGAVLAGLVGATAAVWPAPEKTVNLVVDGQASQIHTTASKVSAVLKSAGYRLGGHDLVAPSANAAIHSGSTIVFKRGRLLRLDVDGVNRNVWTTAPTVADALSQLGFTTANFTSVSRSRRLPLSPTNISVRTPKLVSLKHDGKTQTVTTTDATVAQLLSDLGVTVGAQDRLSVPKNGDITNGAHLVLTRVVNKTVSTTRRVPFGTQHKSDSSMNIGQTKIVTPGKDGLLKITYAVVYIDGRLAGKTKIRSGTVRSARAQIERVGTKRRPQPTSTTTASSASVTPGSAQDIARQLLAARGWGGSNQFDCLVQLWNHESGWRTNANNPGSGAYGIPQALPGSKMASAGADWQTSARTQISWGLNYIGSRYGTPCGAWTTWQAQGGWY
jgi:uncharacterized protein YabE (DUF348 family)